MKIRLSLLLAASILASGFSTPQVRAKPKTVVVRMTPLAFAKSRMVALSQGNTAIENAIAWETFTFVSPFDTMNVGQMYKQMPNAKEKADFRRSFITSFGKSFQQQGDVAALTNWRVKKAGRSQTTVAATAQRGDVEIGVVLREGKMKLGSITLVAKR